MGVAVAFSHSPAISRSTGVEKNRPSCVKSENNLEMCHRHRLLPLKQYDLDSE